MRFSREEFQTMVDELLYREPVSFDMLCQIADKALKPSVIRWCKTEACLQGRCFEDDIMQEVYLRLMKTTVPNFLLREGVSGPYNDDPEGFEDWMFRVADNLKRDFANKVRGRDFKTESLDAPAAGRFQAEAPGETEERISQLKQAFSIVLAADVGVYKVLTWLAQAIFMVDKDVSKIRSNDLILEAFENKTLYEMYDMILTAAKRIPWMAVTKQQDEKIMAALQKKWDADASYGETKYRAFFMKHNGQVSGKKSISDWMNRMNGMIKKKFSQAEGKKRGCADEASNC